MNTQRGKPQTQRANTDTQKKNNISRTTIRQKGKIENHTDAAKKLWVYD